jgi:U3 small nucleolar ribonucleoprotein protein IMP4
MATPERLPYAHMQRSPANMQERGPRFELKLYQIKLGTMDQPHADNEFVLRAYTRSAKKARLAAEQGDEP